jgi:hypothetical protein
MSGCSRHSIVATSLVFMTVVLGNVLPNGLGHPRWGKLAMATALIAACTAMVILRARKFRSLDELQQRVELEALAAAFGGSFLIFWSYWLLQAAGLLPPLNGMYYVLGMVALVGVGSGSAWGRLARRPPARQ